MTVVRMKHDRRNRLRAFRRENLVFDFEMVRSEAFVLRFLNAELIPGVPYNKYHN